MFNRKATGAQLGAWIVAAMAAPLAQFAAGESWLTVAAVGLAGLVLCLAAWGWGWNPQLPGWLAALEWAWIACLLPMVLLQTGASWPQAKNEIAIPLVLLLLAVLSAQQGATRAARACAAAFWLVGLLLAGILGAGVKELEPQWMLPEIRMPRDKAVWAFLLPSIIVFLPAEKPKAGWLLAVGILGAVIAAWTAGVVSPKLAAAEGNPFYLYSESLTVFGTAKRMEALVSAALTMSWFCTLSLLLAGAAHLGERILGKYGVWLAAVLGAIGCIWGLELPEWVPIWGSLLLWVALPLLLAKKSEKSEKSS